MNEKTLAEKISEITPKLINNHLIIRNQRFRKIDYSDYETKRKIGLSKYWGYTYPSYKQSGNPEKHYRNCVDALNSMESKLKDLFCGFQVQTDERVEVPHREMWTEETTMPLFEENYRRGLFAYLFSPFKQFAGGVIKMLKQEHRDFCSVMDDVSGMYGDFNPKTERLMVLKSKGDGEAIFSVSPNRSFRGYSNGVSLEIGKYIGYMPLPILLQLKGFNSGDKEFRKLHEKLASADFGQIKREFPFVPTQPDIALNKFHRLVHQHTKRNEYTKSHGARFTIEDGLRKGLVTFEEAEELLPKLYSGEIVFESPIIRDLRSKVKKSTR